MKKGQIVKVYEDPITMNIFEGRARLIEHYHNDDDRGEYWAVVFVDEDNQSDGDGVFNRWINKK